VNLLGLKFPDEYFIKFFFKHNFHNQKDLKFLELGCSNANNLLLPYNYAHKVIGIDLDNTLIKYANKNFQLQSLKNSYKFYTQDMREFCSDNTDILADVLVLANSLYYIQKEDFIKLLKDVKKNSLIKSESTIFVRFRNIDDYRNHKGQKVVDNGYIMNNGVTGEDGVFCQFFTMEEMVTILREELNLKNFQTMKIIYDNIQNGTKVTNSDSVIWGTIN
jgi:cyclopropane fatty-acyl-phospholipid synthase-like methyltransferase